MKTGGFVDGVSALSIETNSSRLPLSGWSHSIGAGTVPHCSDDAGSGHAAGVMVAVGIEVAVGVDAASGLDDADEPAHELEPHAARAMTRMRLIVRGVRMDAPCDPPVTRGAPSR